MSSASTTSSTAVSLAIIPNSRFLNKRVLVTGGTSGIGKAIAYAFANNGGRVVVTGRRKDKGETIAEEIKGYYLCIDHSKTEDNQRVIAETVKLLGGLDILINNVGIVLHGTIEETSYQDWMDIFQVNVHSTYTVTKDAIPFLRSSAKDQRSNLDNNPYSSSSIPSSSSSSLTNRNHSIVINIASDWGIVGARQYMAYCTTKAAIVQMTKCLALDYISEGIRVNCVCPGDTYVERWNEEGYYRGSTSKVTLQQANEEAAFEQTTGGGIPIGRVANTDEIVTGVLFLASYESSYMVGQSLIIDGGNTCK